MRSGGGFFDPAFTLWYLDWESTKTGSPFQTSGSRLYACVILSPGARVYINIGQFPFAFVTLIRIWLTYFSLMCSCLGSSGKAYPHCWRWRMKAILVPAAVCATTAVIMQARNNSHIQINATALRDSL